MISLRDKLIFCAGAEFLHTISHFILYVSGITMKVWGINCTPALNLWSALFNGAVTVGLLWWVSKLKKKN